jgi:GT2 family glycosyltransferase
MAIRRLAFADAGYFDNELGRKAGTLLGQEVREWCLRVRAAGMTGFYVPQMVIHHKVPTHRLCKSYFRRSFYWRGVSRAIFYRVAGVDMETPEGSLVDPARVPHIAGVPRYLYRTFLSAGFRLVRGLAQRDSYAILDNEMQLWFYVGIFVESWKNVGAKRSRARHLV